MSVKAMHTHLDNEFWDISEDKTNNRFSNQPVIAKIGLKVDTEDYRTLESDDWFQSFTTHTGDVELFLWRWHVCPLKADKGEQRMKTS